MDLILFFFAKIFLPAYREVYGYRKGIFFFDNAPYHKCAHDRKRLTDKSGKDYLRKSDLQKLWEEWDIDRIVVNGKIFDSSVLYMSSDKRRSIRGPNIDELRTGIIKWITHHMEYLEWILNDVEKFAREHNFRVIWTPPYHPELQPIELVWVEVKLCVRNCFFIDRGITGLLHDVKIGFEGGKCYHTDFVCPGINVYAVRKKIRRAFRYAQKWGEQFNGDDFDLYKYWNESVDSLRYQFF